MIVKANKKMSWDTVYSLSQVVAVCFAGEAAGDAAVFGEGEGELVALGIVCAVSGVQRATLATQKMTAR
jgi:hypothetical protein